MTSALQFTDLVGLGNDLDGVLVIMSSASARTDEEGLAARPGGFGDGSCFQRHVACSDTGVRLDQALLPLSGS